MLDLMHFRCNRVYVPWVNKRARRTASRNIISKLIAQIAPYHCLIFCPRFRFKDETQLVSDEPPCYQAGYIHAGLGFTEIMDNSNTIQMPATQVSDEQAATEPLRLSEKVVLVPPSAPHLALHPALSITTHLFDGSATPIKYSMVSPFCTGRCREEPEGDVEPKADVVCTRTQTLLLNPSSVDL